MTNRITRSLRNREKINYLELLSSFEEESLYNSESDEDWDIESESSKKNENPLIKELEEYTKSTNKSFKEDLIEKPWDLKTKAYAFNKIKLIENLDKNSSDYYKQNEYINNLFKIPIGIYKPFSIKNMEPHIFLKWAHEELNNIVYGHDKCKKRVIEIIAQWIVKKDSINEPIGFFGPPGIGKTTIIREGFSKILDRPFGYITLGGSSDSSYLDGHSFTYEGSQYGRIIDILIQSQCMNPIIYFDELDKISNTPKGEEITNLLIHLIDTSQNNTFQDKYFSGIDIDLSKALFIFSYNDATKIDTILLDRFHRIKFEHLSLDDKLVISKKYILPELYKKFEINECINFTDEILEYIINTYTYESGVRKLKEILYEIIGEINLEILELTNTDNFPITLTQDMITNKYLKNKIEVTFTKIHKQPQCGLISGLWANSLGKGGIIQIECAYIPSNSMLDLKLTGSLGDVMKESSEVAKDVAWSLTDVDTQTKILNDCSGVKKSIRIHFPEGATPKNGPSAGTAVAIVIYSLFNNKKIKNDIAITGEINLQKNVTAIGGLDLKILGGIKAGVKEFIFPKDNEKDFNKFLEKYEHKKTLKNIKFHMVETIHEVIDLVFI